MEEWEQKMKKEITKHSIQTLNGHKYSGGANSQGSDSSFICDNSPFYLTASGALIIFNDFLGEVSFR